MARNVWPRVITAALSCAALAAQNQNQAPARLRQDHPPDIFDNRSPDAARIAPDRYKVELNNDRMRVLRAKVPPSGRVPIHGHRSGILLAVTELNLRLIDPNGKVLEVRLPAGDFKWIDAGIHAEENAAATACEYLFIESKD